MRGKDATITSRSRKRGEGENPPGQASARETRNWSEKLELAGEPGFEPGPTESESAVLPLNYSPSAPDRRSGVFAERLIAPMAREMQCPTARPGSRRACRSRRRNRRKGSLAASSPTRTVPLNGTDNARPDAGMTGPWQAPCRFSASMPRPDPGREVATIPCGQEPFRPRNAGDHRPFLYQRRIAKCSSS